jgi:hypothetical protein
MTSSNINKMNWGFNRNGFDEKTRIKYENSTC